jgi:hypothetical protein
MNFRPHSLFAWCLLLAPMDCSLRRKEDGSLTAFQKLSQKIQDCRKPTRLPPTVATGHHEQAEPRSGPDGTRTLCRLPWLGSIRPYNVSQGRSKTCKLIKKQTRRVGQTPVVPPPAIGLAGRCATPSPQKRLSTSQYPHPCISRPTIDNCSTVAPCHPGEENHPPGKTGACSGCHRQHPCGG